MAPRVETVIPIAREISPSINPRCAVQSTSHGPPSATQSSATMVAASMVSPSRKSARGIRRDSKRRLNDAYSRFQAIVARFGINGGAAGGPKKRAGRSRPATAWHGGKPGLSEGSGANTRGFAWKGGRASRNSATVSALSNHKLGATIPGCAWEPCELRRLMP